MECTNHTQNLTTTDAMNGSATDATSTVNVSSAVNATSVEDSISAMTDALRGFASFADLTSSLLFRPISPTQIEGLAELDWGSFAQINPEFATGCNHISRYLAKRNSGTRQELACDYTASMGGMSTWEGHYAVPCASVFTSEDGLLYQDSYHEAYRLFQANGVTRTEGFDYPDDHLSLLLGFLGIMATRAAEALEHGEASRATEIFVTCNSCIQTSINPWFEDFADVAEKLITTRFYRGVISITRGLLQYGQALFADCLEEMNSQAA